MKLASTNDLPNECEWRRDRYIKGVNVELARSCRSPASCISDCVPSLCERQGSRHFVQSAFC